MTFNQVCFFVLFVYLESKNKQAHLPNYMISTKKENKLYKANEGNEV